MTELSPAVEAVRALARVARVIERASDDLSFADYRVLAAITSGDQRATRLAQRLALGKPAISASIESLSKRGLIVKSSVEGDNRAVALSLSPQGAEAFASTERRMAEALEELAAETPDESAVIHSLIWLGESVEHLQAQRFARMTAK
jgi:DNA-binding MarR family transcriptional regulator